MEKARNKSSSEDKADTNEDEEEDELVVDKPILSAGTAISYQDDLRDFALSRQSPGLVELISKSRTAIEKLMCNPDRLKQTKLSDFFTMVPTCLYFRTCSPQLLPFIVV